MTDFHGPQMIRRGEVRQVRELKRGVQAHVCLGSSAQHGSAVVMVTSTSPKVMAALAALKEAIKEDALALYQSIQGDQMKAAP